MTGDPASTNRTASCQCGRLTATCTGDPVRVSVCHCLDCQKRSGSAFAAQARWPVERVVMAGETRTWSRTGDDGGTATFHFCPTCGSGVYYTTDGQPELVAVAVGAFADPSFRRPDYSVYEERQLGWVAIVGEGIDHHD
ncbi:MAG: GFA family protein [Sphingomonadales bacterium]|nr:GFA family protein [Sphingomonadales bacterium]MBD3772942.1 GFA family protein [Paracoccaceae bacterium]